MNASHALQLVGTVGVMGLAGVMASLAVSRDRYTRYGRETLLLASAFLVSTVVVRMLALFEVISMTDARIANGMAAVVTLVIVLEIAYLARVERKHRREP